MSEVLTDMPNFVLTVTPDEHGYRAVVTFCEMEVWHWYLATKASTAEEFRQAARERFGLAMKAVFQTRLSI